jgi:hypothetical protein
MFYMPKKKERAEKEGKRNTEMRNKLCNGCKEFQ